MQERDTGARWVLISLCVVAGMAVVVLLAYSLTFGPELSTSNDTWGTFGDYVGGLLNPVVAFAALLFLARTYLLQRKELAETSRALKEQANALDVQRRESRFFDLLRLYQDTLDEVRYRRGEHFHEGKRAFFEFRVVQGLDKELGTDLTDVSAREMLVEAAVLRHDYLFAHYFRVIFNILTIANQLLGEQEFVFVKLLRAQLSRDELFVIALNLLEGEGVKMRALVQRYGLLKHLQKGRLRDYLLSELPVGSFGRQAIAAQHAARKSAP